MSDVHSVLDQNIAPLGHFAHLQKTASLNNNQLLHPHLGLSLYGVHSADELTVSLKQQKQLKVQLIESPAQLQLLHRQKDQQELHESPALPLLPSSHHSTVLG